MKLKDTCLKLKNGTDENSYLVYKRATGIPVLKSNG